MPPPVIVATPGAANANSFVTHTQAEAYFEGRLHASVWKDASPADQRRALIDFTRELNVLAWGGERASETQSLAFPREGLRDPDRSSDLATVHFPDDVIPSRIADATCEGALAYLRSESDPAERDVEARVKRRKVGPIETEFDLADRAASVFRVQRVSSLIVPLLARHPSEVVRA